MSVTIAVPNIGTATVTNGKWRCNKFMKTLLIGINKDRLDEEIGYYPSLDYGLAELATSLLGGTITKVTNQYEYVEGRVY